MPEAEPSANPMENEERDNLRIIYNEAVELQKLQQGGIDLLYNKLNWILVSDIVFLAALYTSGSPNVFVACLVTASAIVTLCSLESMTFHFTVQLSKQLETIGHPKFLNHLLEMKPKIINATSDKLKRLHRFFFWSGTLLILGLLLQFVLLTYAS